MSALLEKFKLDGKNAVVTGASSGIGRAMAGFLAAAGAHVVLVARRESELRAATDEILSIPGANQGTAAYVAADLGQREHLSDIALACKARTQSGGVDIVVNAAGLNLRESPAEVSLESWDATLNLNLAVPFFFTREFVPEMRSLKYGRVINIASLQSTRAFANGLPYGASKGGVCQLTRAMAEAWSRDGICCNALAPGFFPTELTAPVFDDPVRSERFAQQTAIGRNGKLEDLAGVTVFFAAEASAYITGQTLAVDGGFTAK
jgi:NAD(P)-dependent dehydrogenase (short-subunit alcohol dehydrogenase family)